LILLRSYIVVVFVAPPALSDNKYGDGNPFAEKNHTTDYFTTKVAWHKDVCRPRGFAGQPERKNRLFSVDNAAGVWRDERLYRANVHG
jgi:hypothetical protein